MKTISLQEGIELFKKARAAWANGILFQVEVYDEGERCVIFLESGDSYDNQISFQREHNQTIEWDEKKNVLIMFIYDYYGEGLQKVEVELLIPMNIKENIK